MDWLFKSFEDATAKGGCWSGTWSMNNRRQNTAFNNYHSLTSTGGSIRPLWQLFLEVMVLTHCQTNTQK